MNVNEEEKISILSVTVLIFKIILIISVTSLNYVSLVAGKLSPTTDT